MVKELAVSMKAFWSWWVNSARVLAGLIIASVAFFAPNIDGYFRPAVSAFNIDLVKSRRIENALYLHGTMVKNRCTFIGVKVTGYSDTRAVTLPILFQDNDVDQSANRPTEPQQFGPWRVIVALPWLDEDVWGISMKSAHLCGAGMFTWTIYTDLGPIVVLESLERVKP